MAEPGITPPANERGAALLTVLMLVAVMAVITTIALERLTIATRMAQNGVSTDQGRAFLTAGETMAAMRLGDLVTARADRTTLQGNWLGTPQTVPVPGGSVIARVRDAGNCFNVNSVVTGDTLDNLVASPVGIKQFSALLRLLGTDPQTAEQIAQASADWIDSNSSPQPGGGQEDSYYQQLPEPYRTAGTLVTDPSEIRTVAGMTAPIYDRVRPWLCALPVAALSPININTLLPDQAILLAMLTDGRVGPDAARQLLARRPQDGYGSLVTFWGQPALSALGVPPDVSEQTKLSSRWFEVDLRVNLGGTDVSETALFDARKMPVRLARRRWGDEY
ncbi:MAG TPA: type II secretion system minor pseudopilin GspK [Sphingobium sp.]|uniref:type II secretion system minor pseudopilin GspK n=1 Tax=Sphingobium sp. TaxID=1912891 RepID=UPI002ED4F061